MAEEAKKSGYFNFSDPREVKFKVGTAIAVVSVASIGGYLLNLWNLAKKLIVIPTVRIHQLFGSDGMNISAQVELRNPTNTSLEIEKIFVSVYENVGNEKRGGFIGSSRPENSKSFTIEKNQTTTPDAILVNLPYQQIINAIYKFLTKGKENLDLLIEVQAQVRINAFLKPTVPEKVELSLPIKDLLKFDFKNSPSKISKAQIESLLNANASKAQLVETKALGSVLLNYL